MQEKSLSERQKEILAEIIRFKKENGFSPTVRELCKLVGLKSTSSMAAQLSNLRDSGHITWIESMPRTITVSKLDEFDEEVIRYLIDYVLVYDNEHIEIRWNFDDFQAG